MATSFVTTKPNSDSIFLSVDTSDMRASTSIFQNGHLVKTLDDSFGNFYLGTNASLKSGVIVVATQVFHFPASATTSNVVFTITGAADVEPTNPYTSTQTFQDGAPTVPHLITFYFL